MHITMFLFYTSFRYEGEIENTIIVDIIFLPFVVAPTFLVVRVTVNKLKRNCTHSLSYMYFTIVSIEF